MEIDSSPECKMDFFEAVRKTVYVSFVEIYWKHFKKFSKTSEP
jgi:hypothetical protein